MKPFWQPQQTLSDLACYNGAKDVPRTNWGTPMRRDGVREYSTGAERLNSAMLTQADVRVLSSLTLSTEHFNPTTCALFEGLMRVLPVAWRPGGIVQDAWIHDLLGLMPACTHDHHRYHNAGECAAEYVEMGLAPFLLPLYTLMLRGGFWQRRLDHYTKGPELNRTCIQDPKHSGLVSEPQCALPRNVHGYSFEELVGDPCGITYEYGLRWSSDFMHARDLLLRSYRNSDAARDAAHDILFTLDVMAHVVATLDRGLNDRMTAYDQWVAGT